MVPRATCEGEGRAHWPLSARPPVAASSSIVKVGGYVGVLTALVAWYTSAAGVINGMRGSALLPVGKPFGMAPAS